MHYYCANCGQKQHNNFAGDVDVIIFTSLNKLETDKYTNTHSQTHTRRERHTHSHYGPSGFMYICHILSYSSQKADNIIITV